MASNKAKRSHLKSCEAAGCEHQEGHMFLWPKDAERAAKWTAFVSLKRKAFKPSSTSRLCYKHFKEEDFSNFGRYKNNLVKV